MANLTVGVLKDCMVGLPDETIVCASDQDGNPIAWDDSEAERAALSPKRDPRWVGKFGVGNVLTIGGSPDEYDELMMLDEVRKFCDKQQEEK